MTLLLNNHVTKNDYTIVEFSNQGSLIDLQHLGNAMATVKRKGEILGCLNEACMPLRELNQLILQKKEEERAYREKLVLWVHPIATFRYFIMELLYIMSRGFQRMAKQKLAVFSILFYILIITALFLFEGPHSQFLALVQKKVLWCLYWLGLGILSSVGLGTGLHTFVLYLGPHIASVTLAAYECNSLSFPEPPYPNELICPENRSEGVSIAQIMAKVRLEAMMWGAGTALGELPPYFMARAARLSGYDPEDDTLDELNLKKDKADMNFVDRTKLYVERLVKKVGFLAILACASIPNPLFDLAGITCGHFLVPFWKFFGATLIGKAVIKMHIQKLFIIIICNEKLLEQSMALFGRIPYIGQALQQPFETFLQKQKMKMHRKSTFEETDELNIISWIFEKIVIAMVLYFCVSIINSLAQNQHKRLCQESKKSKFAKD